MEREEVVREVLEAMGVGEEQLGLAGKLLGLRKDTERVGKVRLYHQTIGYLGLSGEVLMKKGEGFRGIGEFRGFLRDRGIKPEHTWNDQYGTYYLIQERIQTKFFVPDTNRDRY
ncbi:hypothetical protein COU61_03845 [Candidatus Pacearchaeota archaeon CG10_big_fil_rev_8_21_14_0_10_35_13]|nr:MAG: hypothetical protein COU61_03845 [Candidatus Pacearchaeota archaeon CG10_big_fil_rev_8_21_14_0_10_35_13]